MRAHIAEKITKIIIFLKLKYCFQRVFMLKFFDLLLLHLYATLYTRDVTFFRFRYQNLDPYYICIHIK